MPKHNTIDNISRMLQVLKLMAREQGTTITEISQKTGIDRWTVRDMIASMEDLETDGRGLCIEEFQSETDKRQTIYRVPKDNLWSLTLPGMSLSDEEGILLALMFSQSETSPMLKEASTQLKVKLNMFKDVPSYEIMNVATAKKATTELTQDILVALLNAIQTDDAVHFCYSPVRRPVTEYTLRPLGVFRYDAGYYLAAQKLPEGEYRTFGIERVTEVPYVVAFPKDQYPPREPYEEKFKDPFGPFGHRAEFQAVLKFDAFHGSFNAERKWPQDLVCMEQQPDESIIMKIRTHTYPGIKKWILGFGSGVEVLEPEWLRNAIRDEHLKAAGMYPAPEPKGFLSEETAKNS